MLETRRRGVIDRGVSVPIPANLPRNRCALDSVDQGELVTPEGYLSILAGTTLSAAGVPIFPPSAHMENHLTFEAKGVESDLG